MTRKWQRMQKPLQWPHSPSLVLDLKCRMGADSLLIPAPVLPKNSELEALISPWKSVWSMKKNQNKGICCYMCCNHFTVEAFNVCCSWNILTVTENIVNFKHLPRIFWGSEIRVGAKLLILRIDEVTGICKAFYFGADREKSAKFITMQNGSQPTSRAARENSLSRKSYYEWG